MSNAQRGKLVLQEVPTGEVERRVVMLLSKFAKSTSPEQLTTKVRNTPYALSNDISVEKALIVLEALQKLGATAAFVPHAPVKPAAEEITTIERPARFTFESPPLPEEESAAVQPEPRKNGTRRLVMTLVTILLLLSIGFLAWQLWPMIEDTIREWWSTLKQLL
ncbi:MAG: hypothetical protein PVI71_00030 [Desulfobacterales bacterium]|jgi:hypothetical protein